MDSTTPDRDAVHPANYPDCTLDTPTTEELLGPVLGYCPHGVNLDREFCPEGCRV